MQNTKVRQTRRLPDGYATWSERRKNIIAPRLKALRRVKSLPQRELASQLQLNGLDVDKNVLTCIETQNRYVTDMEILAIGDFLRCHIAFC